MLDMFLSFLQEQGNLVLMGILLVGGIFGQVMASVRFRKLRKGMQALISLNPREVNRENEAKESFQENVPVPNETIVPQTGSAVQQKGTSQESFEEADSQLLYLKQSLDRIAAGRDQKLEEEPKGHRKLTPAEEQIIVDILKEYLS